MRDLWRSPLFNTFKNDIELFGLVAGLRPVAKKEGPDAVAVMKLSDDLSAAGFRAAMNERTGCAYVSRDADRIELLMKLENREFDGGEPGLRAATIREIGVLLGYPDCCARAFAAHPVQDDAHVMGEFIARESAAAGSSVIRGLPWLLNFLPPLVSPVFFYPCTARCPAAFDLAGKYMDAMDDAAPGTRETMRRRLTGVVLAAGRWDFVMLDAAMSSDGSAAYSRWNAPDSFHPVPPCSAAFAEFMAALPAHGTIWIDGSTAFAAATRRDPPVAAFRPQDGRMLLLEYT